MSRNLAVIAAVVALAACGQAEAPKQADAPAAPQSLLEQVEAMPAEQRPVFAWQQLTAYQQAHPEAQPPCTSIRRADVIGHIPDDVAPESIYAAYEGAFVFTVQCGPQLTTVGDDPREHWLVAFAPGATEAAIANCANEQGRSECVRIPPRAAPAP